MEFHDWILNMQYVNCISKQIAILLKRELRWFWGQLPLLLNCHHFISGGPTNQFHALPWFRGTKKPLKPHVHLLTLGWSHCWISVANNGQRRRTWTNYGLWASAVNGKRITPPKFNIEPENDGLEDDFPFPGLYSQVPGVYTSFG